MEYFTDGVSNDNNFEITEINLQKLLDSGAMIGNSLDGYFLNPHHSFTRDEVIILINGPMED